MRFKVGDKVKVREDLEVGKTYGNDNVVIEMLKYRGKIVTINQVFDRTERYYIEQDDNYYAWTDEMLEPVEYTYEDLCNAPVGIKITFESEQVLVKNGNRRWDNENMYRNDEDLEGFKDIDGIEGKIIKIEEPTYTTVYEAKADILDEKEREYLGNVIRSFRDKVKSIVKSDFEDKEYICVRIKSNYSDNIDIDFPVFEKGTMYKGMEVDKEYSLEELGLYETQLFAECYKEECAAWDRENKLSMDKESLINDIVLELVNTIGVENTKEVKKVLILKMKDYELSKKETGLTVKQEENAIVVQKFIACKKLQGCTNRTLGAYLKELADFFKVTQKNIKDIKVDDVRLYLALAERTCKSITVDNKRRYLNSFFGWATTEEIIARNPIQKIDKIKSIRKVKEAFTDYEVEKMRNYLQNGRRHYCKGEYREQDKLRDIAIFEVLLSTGLRVAELVSIKKEQVQEEAEQLTILGKGNKERIVYLNARSRIAIKNYIDKRKDDNEALFVSYYSKEKKIVKMSISAVEVMIRNLGKKVDVVAYPHKFRRTTATMAVNKGMPIEQVQKMLGHASLNTTQIYVTTSEKEVKNSHEKYFN